MSAPLSDRTSSAFATMPDVTRISIREVREATFRALVAAGASSAEAKLAAEQVLFTELHRGSGLGALLEDLEVGPWVRAGLECEREYLDERLVLRVTGPGRPGALRQGGLLVDLLAAEPEPGALVVSDGLTALTSFLDEPLIRTARSTGNFVLATDRSASSLDFRIASPDGAIGVGVAGATTSPGHDLVPVVPGVALSRLEAMPDLSTSWLTAGEQGATRAAVAQHGVMVDAALWREVSAAASAYLVPEQ